MVGTFDHLLSFFDQQLNDPGVRNLHFFPQDDFPGAGYLHVNRKTDLSSNPPPMPGLPPSCLTLIDA